MSVLDSDGEELQQGDYIAVNNVWGKYSLGDVPSYTQSITIDNDADLSSGIHMDWNWNVDASNHKVLAYPEISVGYKPWDAPGHGTSSLSGRIQDIKSFDVTHDLSIGGDTSRFNVSYDLWLTDEPMGDHYDITTELMVWTHKGGPVDNGTVPVGTYTQGGVTFNIIVYENFGDPSGNTSSSWRYIALVPQTDLLNTTVDLHAVLFDLIDRGLVSDKDYITGYELGAEVTGGAGNLTINHVSHDLEVYGADAKANILTGTDGDDRMYGLGGKDTLLGNGGNDFLSGGKHADKLTGGDGNDIFYFNDLGKAANVIYDFTVGQDTIVLDADIYSALTNGDLGADDFKRGRRFDTDSHLLYDAKSGKLFYDADGSGIADTQHIIARLDNHAKLTFSDFDVL